MAVEIERPSEVALIPAAPGIKLENLIQFDGDCIDPLALIIITESLDYALETSVRRLRSAGKIFSGVEESAYGKGKGIIPTIKAVRDAILQAPQCTPAVPKVMPPPVEEAIAAEAKARAAKPKVEKKKPTPEELKRVEAAIAGAKTREELLEAVKGFPELEKAIAARKELPEKKPKEKRELPGLWGKATFEDKEYESPQVLAKELGIITRGAKDMLDAFTRAGFEVRGDGKKAVKGKTGFVVKRVSPTPKKYKVKEIYPELAAPGAVVLPPGPRPQEFEEVTPEVEEEWVVIKSTEGKVIAWEPIDPKTGESIFERRVWAGSEEARELGFE